MKKSVIKNYIYNLSYQILVLLLPLVTTPYLARVIGPSGNGAFGYTDSITQFFVLFGCIGLNLYGEREIAYNQNDLYNRSVVFFELLTIRIVTVSIATGVFYFTVCQDKRYGYLFTIQIVELIASMIDVSWFFQGMEEFKKIVIRNTLVKVSGVILIFLLVKGSNDVGKYCAIYVLTLFAGNFSMWIYLPKYIKKIDAKDLHISRHIKPALVLFVPQIATNMYNLLDKFMIGFITGNDAEVDFYEQAQKIVKVVLSIPTALGTVMMPRVANMFGEGQYNEIRQYLYKSLRFVCAISFPLCLGLCSVAKGFVPWFYGPGYEKVVLNIIVISPIVIAVGLSNVTGVQFLLPVGRQKDFTISVVLGTAVNFILNILLISRFLSYGAAFASVLAECSVTVFQAARIRKEFSFLIVLKSVLKYIASSIIMLAVITVFSVYIMPNGMLGSALGTIIQIALGGITYAALLLLLKDELVLDVLKRFKKV